MSKRKSSADLRHGISTPRRQTIGANPQARAMNVARNVSRKPGATNVRPTSSCKFIQRQTGETQRSSSNVPGARKSTVVRNRATEMPRTRFNSANSWITHTLRLKDFPVESAKKTVGNKPYSPCSMRQVTDQNLCERVESSFTGTNTNTRVTNLPSHGYGDAVKLRSAEELMRCPQLGKEIQQNPKHGITISQPEMPIAPHVNGFNQSQAMLNNQVPSPGQPIPRAFVPNVGHGMVVRDSSLQRSAVSSRPPAQQGSTLCAEQNESHQHDQVRSTAIEHEQRPRDSVSQQISQITHKSMVTQPNRRSPILLENIIPWKVDDSATVHDYKIQPTRGKNTTEQSLALVLNNKLDKPQCVISTEQPINPCHDPCNAPGIDRRVKEQQQEAHQPQLYQQQHHQYLKRQGLGTMHTLQNAQQMYQQLQTNLIHQQELQQRALSQQQQMMMLTQQRMRQQPLSHESQIPIQQSQIDRQPCNDCYDTPLIHRTELRESDKGSRITSPQNIHSNKISIPHYRVLMRGQNTGYRISEISPQQGWVHNHRVIGDHPSIKGQLKPFTVDLVLPTENNMPLNNITHCEPLKCSEASLPVHQQLRDRPAGVQWAEKKTCPQYQIAMHQYPLKHTQQGHDQVSSQPYVSHQQERQTSVSQPQTSLIHRHELSQKQQELIKEFDPHGIHRMSQTAKNKYAEFTAEMIRDQESLVANMRQQKIPDNTMRRQFDALLDEQRRHLAFHNRQEAAEKVYEPPARRTPGTIPDDQRPDWMERITPARIAVQNVHNSRDTLNQQDTEKDQNLREADRKLMKQYGQSESETSPQVSNRPQYSKFPSHQLHNQNYQDTYQLWQRQTAHQQYDTGLLASPFYSNVSLPQVLSAPQATFSWAHQNNSLESDPQSRFVQPNYFEAQYQQQLQQQQQQQQQRLQHQFKQQLVQQQSQLLPNQRAQIHRNQSTNYRQTQQVEQMTDKQYQQREKTMLQEIKGQCPAKSNTYEEQTGLHYKPNEPTSLLKLREFKQYTRPQSQFNGLQDAETMKVALEALKNPETKKGLEYVADLEKKVSTLKLNGTQNPCELAKIVPPPLEYLQRLKQQQQPKISSNGLCNSRNANNPSLPPKYFPKNIDQSPMPGYPRQYCSGEKSRANMTESSRKVAAENESGRVAGAIHQTDHTKPPETVPIMPYRFDGLEPQYQQQMEQFYRNRLNLKNSDKCNITVSTRGPGAWNETIPVSQILRSSTGETIYPEKVGEPPKTRPDYVHQHQSVPIEETSQQSAMLTYKLRDATEIAQNKDAIAQFSRTIAGRDHGQPEIRKPIIIGGLRYLARKVDTCKTPC